MNRKMILATSLMAMAMSDLKPINYRHHMELPNNPKQVIPKGCKVWHEYGGVIAVNEKNAKRKYAKLKAK